MGELTGWVIIAAGVATLLYGWVVLLPDLRKKREQVFRRNSEIRQIQDDQLENQRLLNREEDGDDKS
mgnify:CR=1 FL=1